MQAADRWWCLHLTTLPVVEADDKLWARVKCLKTVVEAIQLRLG